MTGFKVQVSSLLRKHWVIGNRSNQFLKELVPLLILLFIAQYSNTNKTFWNLTNILTCLYMIVVLGNFVYQYCEDKGEKVLETYKIMGLSNFNYQTSWFIIIYAKGFLLTFALMSVWYIQQHFLFHDEDRGVFAVVLIAYCMAQINQVFFFTTFFSKAKIASLVYALLYIGQVALIFAGTNTEDGRNLNLLLALISPNFALQSALKQFTNRPGYNKIEVQIYEVYPNEYIPYMFLSAVMYFVLYWYLFQVLPNDYGSQKPLYFCFMCRRRSPGKQVHGNSNAEKQLDLEKQGGDYQEDFSSAVYHEKLDDLQKLKRSILIKDLKKNFGSFKAVDQVSLCLYENQIFCLLGHNGAGKTTTINVLTGMYNKSGGKVEMNGMDLDYDLQDIRKKVGLCNQKDVLFDNFTIEEHLEFMCDIKGYPDEKRDQEIRHIIEHCCLRNEKGKYAQNLSGGNKRKLSLAMALIADSEILFLDEPSSGLDPASRRTIWGILKEVKNQNRTIILTTHHLEEAEELASRIGIMAKGKLLTVGQTDFIKKKFGIGFHLEIIMQQNLKEEEYAKQKGQYFQIVQKHIENAKIDPQSSKEILKITLPYDQKKNFTSLFQELENFKEISMNLELNSLEEAFVNIGMDEQRLLKNQENNNLNTQNKDASEEQLLMNEDVNQKMDQIEQPAVLQRPPTYSFWNQSKAIFLRRIFMTLRTPVYIIAFLIPLAIVIVGPIIAQNQVTKFVRYDEEVEQEDPETGDKWYMYFTRVLNFNPYKIKFENQIDLITMTYGFSMCFFMLFQIMPIVFEKEKKLKYSLNVMGCRLTPYWFGNFLFDFIYMLLIIVIFLIVGNSLDNMKIMTETVGDWILVTIPGGLAILSTSYFVTFWFETQSSTQRYALFLIIVIFYGAPIFLTNAVERNQNYSKYDVIYVTYQFLSPIFNIMEGMKCILFVNKDKLIDTTEYIPNKLEITANIIYDAEKKYYQYTGGLQEMIGFCLIALIQSLAYYILVLYKDLNASNLKNQKNIKSKIDDDDFLYEEEVVNEEKRLDDPKCDDIVKVCRLTKQYPNGFTAVRNNNFGVKQGEIFGLLGPNGAGKSTTFNILTSLIPKTSGSVQLKNTEVDKGIMQIYQDVGVCPQIDPLWPTLSVYHHLKLFGMMKGLSGKDLDDSINYYIQVMQLTAYKNVQSEKLSGGNKRKLCVTMALIGGPNIQFFDEPSSGVDPIAKRFLWNSLTHNIKNRNSAITLTTHSMVEAENLSTKIGILVNGRMQCYGTPNFLKKKYGEGYLISVNYFKQNEKDLFKNVGNTFSEARRQYQDVDSEVQKNQLLNASFSFPFKDFSFYKTFQFFDELVQNDIIKDFSLTQSSLEQIFLQISKQQKANSGNPQ